MEAGAGEVSGVKGIALTLCLAVCGTAHAADDAKLYKDNILRFQLQIAEGWTTEPVLRLPGETVLRIVAPRPRSEHDVCVISISEGFGHKPQAELDRLVRESRSAPEPSALSMQKLFWSGRVTKDEMVDLNGRTARVVENKELGIYALEFLTPDHVFHANCFGSAEHYAALRPSFLRMLHSLRAFD
jgi:hypothetical protein